jgi:hypothetical protein
MFVSGVNVQSDICLWLLFSFSAETADDEDAFVADNGGNDDAAWSFGERG